MVPVGRFQRKLTTPDRFENSPTDPRRPKNRCTETGARGCSLRRETMESRAARAGLASAPPPTPPPPHARPSRAMMAGVWHGEGGDCRSRLPTGAYACAVSGCRAWRRPRGDRLRGGLPAGAGARGRLPSGERLSGPRVVDGETTGTRGAAGPAPALPSVSRSGGRPRPRQARPWDRRRWRTCRSPIAYGHAQRGHVPAMTTRGYRPGAGLRSTATQWVHQWRAAPARPSRRRPRQAVRTRRLWERNGPGGGGVCRERQGYSSDGNSDGHTRPMQ